MSKAIKNQKKILNKLDIEQLNAMQEAAQFAIHSNSEIVLLSPTGTGKTLAFLLPIIAELDPDCAEVQVLILVPSRELAIQIEQVTREMGAGYKTNAVYGGRAFSKDKIELKHRPAILIGTPGRIAAHLRRETISTDHIKTLVLDEFDKSLEVGFEEEMSEIVAALPEVNKKILTSATQSVDIPEFVGLQDPTYIDYLDEGIDQLKVKMILSPSKDKLETLVDALCHLGNQPGIIFCNFKDSIQRVSDFLTENKIAHGCFFGGMEQQDRERALIKFRNGTHQLIIATDLAARGIDIPELKFIIHYHLPPRSQEFTHRNGRTARMNNEGTAYILKWTLENLPDFIQNPEIEEIQPASLPAPSIWKTLFISGGRKDKISKGDIAGLFFKQGNLNKDELGVIELKQDCAFVAVHASKVDQLVRAVDNSRLKKKKVRVTVI
ncbi:MAG: helicase [Saprospiraceae bacterium]|nr:MAG: helicase [Saprospiraceae bacterium]